MIFLAFLQVAASLKIARVGEPIPPSMVWYPSKNGITNFWTTSKFLKAVINGINTFLIVFGGSGHKAQCFIGWGNGFFITLLTTGLGLYGLMIGGITLTGSGGYPINDSSESSGSPSSITPTQPGLLTTAFFFFFVGGATGCYFVAAPPYNLMSFICCC